VIFDQELLEFGTVGCVFSTFSLRLNYDGNLLLETELNFLVC
jgi:hypothetical protein